MTLIGQDVLLAAGRRNKPLRLWLTEWAAMIGNVAWRNIADIRRSYPSADGVPLASGTVVTVFNVKGNQWRLLAWVDYDSQVVEVLEVITHSQYSKELWKGRY